MNELITILQNSQRIKKYSVEVPNVNIVKRILPILLSEGFICGYDTKLTKSDKIMVQVKYLHGEPVIKKIQYSSNKSFYRPRKNAAHIQEVASNSLVIISTPKGLMTKEKASALNLGGEILCRIN